MLSLRWISAFEGGAAGVGEPKGDAMMEECVGLYDRDEEGSWADESLTVWVLDEKGSLVRDESHKHLSSLQLS